MVDAVSQQYAAAEARGEARLAAPRAASAHDDAGRNRIIVRLTTGVEIGFAPRVAEGLQHASTTDLKAVEIDALDLGIHFPTLDADLYVPALLESVLGSQRWMAAPNGAAGDRTHSGRQGSRGQRGGLRRKLAVT